MDLTKNYIGIIPAAGEGSRMFPFDNSKELLPVGVDSESGQPILVSQYALKTLKAAGINSVIIIINPDKHNILKHHSDGSQYEMNIAYLVGRPDSMVHSIDLAYDWVKGKNVVMVMGDTVIKPESCVSQLIRSATLPNLSLGLFETKNPSKFGMIKVNDRNEIIYHEDKPTTTDTSLMWGLACWSSDFSHVIHDLVANHSGDHEMRFGDVIDYARSNGMVHGYKIENGLYYDVGTYDEYVKAIKEIS